MDYSGPKSEPQFVAGGALTGPVRCYILTVPVAQDFWTEYVLIGLLELASRERQWRSSGETSAAEAAAVFAQILDTRQVVECP